MASGTRACTTARVQRASYPWLPVAVVTEHMRDRVAVQGSAGAWSLIRPAHDDSYEQSAAFAILHQTNAGQLLPIAAAGHGRSHQHLEKIAKASR